MSRRRGLRDAVVSALTTVTALVAVLGLPAAPAGAAGTLDQHQDSRNSGWQVGGGATLGAQTFTAGLTGFLDQVDVAVAKDPRTPVTTEPLTVDIRSVSGGLPTSMVLASALVPAASAPVFPSFTVVSVPIGPVSVAAGTTYAILLGGSGLWVAGLGGSDPYAAGEFRSSVSGTPFVHPFGAANSVDLTFRTYVTRARPSISTQASPGVPVGGQVRDVATLTGAASPTGNVTFWLFSDSTCASPPVFTSTNPVVGGTATSDWTTPGAAGTYYWTAAFEGDLGNEPATSPCNAPNESVTVSPPAKPTALIADPPIAGLLTLRARLTDATTRAPIGGRILVMSTSAGPACQATTLADGTAACNGVGAALQMVAENGYTASFAGDQQFLPSSARASLLTSGAGQSAPTTAPPTTTAPAPGATTPVPTMPSGQLAATGNAPSIRVWGLLLLVAGLVLRRARGAPVRIEGTHASKHRETPDSCGAGS